MVTLPLSTGEALRVILGPDAARALLEALLEHPHLRNVAAISSQPPAARAMLGTADEATDAVPDLRDAATQPPGGRRARRRRAIGQGEVPLRLVSARGGHGTRGEAVLDRAQESLARSRDLIEEIRAGLARREPKLLERKAQHLRALLEQLGAGAAADAARALESAGVQGDVVSAEAAVTALERALVRYCGEP